MEQFLHGLDKSTLRTVIFLGGMLFFLIFELTIPYRASSVSKLKRWVNNFILTIFNGIIIQVAFAAFIVGISHHVTTQKLGVMNLEIMSGLPHWARILIIIIFLDFILYVWHILNHVMPLLWRFHRVHHSDLNMDVSTATRFHIGELAVSTVIKMSLIFLIGADIITIFIYESAVVLCAQFHHSSLRIHRWFEIIWWSLFVPPSMHRIHHSVVRKEMDSNYGTIFSIWDRMMGTLVTGIEQSGIRIGIPPYQSPEKLNIQHLLIMPFTRT